MTSPVDTAATATGDAPERPPGDGSAPRNEVVLVGRVAAAPEERELPSGDQLVSWRVVVARPPDRPARPGTRAVTVDALDCVAWTEPLRQTAGQLVAGDVVEVRGGLRRRFWRAGASAASRCEVEATHLRRLQKARPDPEQPDPEEPDPDRRDAKTPGFDSGDPEPSDLDLAAPTAERASGPP